MKLGCRATSPRMSALVRVVIRLVVYPGASLSVPFVRALPIWLLALFLASCASNHHLRQIEENDARTFPRFLELAAKASASTLHFPAGLYSLDAVDDTGYYYRAPRKVIKHSFSGFVPYDGGIFVRKGDRRKIRGYVDWEGGRTKVGDLSKTPYEFRD